MKKALLGLLTLIFMVSGICCFGTSGREVLAAAGDVTTGDGYIAVEYTDLTTYRTEDGNVAPTAPTGYENYIFAGWYTTSACESVYGGVTANTTLAYAKFVPQEVLSVRCQLKEDASTSDTTNMRLVSSVDGLKYKDVGYEIYYNNAEEPVMVTTDTVYERIVASTTSGVDYKYSPKVVDVESEYFVTATLLNIKKENFGNVFYIKPYWTTLDGTVVYGMSKYVTVNNGLSTSNINMSVRVAKELSNDTLAVTVAGTTYPATAAYYDGTYAHLNVEVENRDTVLKSLSVVTVTDGTTTTSLPIYYRNLMTTYTGDGTADTSWYDVKGAKAKKYVIATSADLYGLATLVNNKTYYFGEQIIYEVCDIEVNKGRAAEDGWSIYEEDGTTAIEGATSHVWTPIGYEGLNFLGTFDGQGHEISGLNGTPTSTATEAFLGLFGLVGTGGELKDFKLTNSYFEERTTGTNYTGSIVGRTNGNIDSVYSDAYIKAYTAITGGIAGRGHGSTQKTFSNCWYDGTITLSGNAATHGGGIVGQLWAGTLTIDSSLFSGDIIIDGVTDSTKTSRNTGGFCGISGRGTGYTTGLTIKNSLNSGAITNVNCGDIKLNSCGGVIGQVTDATTNSVTMDTVYYLNKGMTGTYEWYCANKNSPVFTGTPTSIEESDVIGNCAYFNNIFEYTDDSAWTLVVEETSGVDSTPILKTFADVVPEVPVVPDNADISWFEGIQDSYIICDNTDNALNVKELNGFAFMCTKGMTFEGKTVYLGENVEVNEETISELSADEYANLDAWTPIGTTTREFAGTFDGKLPDTDEIHTISGIYVNTSEKGAGLFTGTAEGSTIQNLKLTNSYINSTNSSTYAVVGSVVAASSGNILNVYSDAIVKSTQSLAGGIVGQMHGSATMNIENCWFNGSVVAKGTCGGIVAAVSTGVVTMNNCLNTGTITGTANSVGGLCGRTFRSTEKYNLNDTATTLLGLQMSNCLNTGKVTCSLWTGSVIGGIQHITKSTMSVSNVYATNESYLVDGVATWCGRNKTSDGTVSTTVAKDDITGTLAYFNDVLVSNDEWSMTVATPELTIFTEGALADPVVEGNIDWYTGLSETDYIICDNDDNAANIEELYGFAYLANQGMTFKDKTITLAKTVTVNEGALNADSNADEQRAWNPIGSFNKPFAGTFEGGSNTISGLYGVTDTEGMGLFRATAEGSTIQNLKLTNSYFATTTSTYGTVGSIVGHCGGNLQNIYSDAIVNTTNQISGGLVGRIWSTGDVSINNCWFDGSVSSTQSYTAGIVAWIQNGTVTMENCLNTGTVHYSHTGFGNTGGLCANIMMWNWETNKETSDYTVSLTIKDSLNVGQVTNGTQARVGSILGNKSGNTSMAVENVYATNESYKLSGVSTHVGRGSYTGTITMVDERNITGICSYYNNILAKDDDWVPTATTPALAIFAEGISTEVPEGVKVDWYTGLDATEYTISDEATNELNAAELYGMAYLANAGINFDGVTIHLANDVTVNDATISELSAEGRAALKQWDPMGSEEVPFAGTFDGELNTISGLCAETTTTYTGLFAALGEGSAVQNLKLKNSYFGSTANYTGSIAGLSEGNLVNIYSDATVSGVQHTGGLVGCIYSESTETIKVNNCWFAGYVAATNVNLGGIAGAIDCGVVEMTDCLNTAKIKGANKNFMGGICGGMTAATKGAVKVTVARCLNVGKLTSSNGAFTGALLGRMNGNASLSMVSVYGTNESHKNVVGSGSPTGTYGMVNASDAIGQAAYYTVSGLGFDDESNWVIVEGTTPQLRLFTDSTKVLDVPTLDEGANVEWYDGTASSYTIMNAEELYGFSYLSDLGMMFEEKTVKLGADIDLNEGWIASSTPEAAKQWTPVGVDARPFSGTFDGQNYSISGVYVDAAVDYLGFFGTTGYSSSIQNFRILNSYFNQQIVGSELTGFTASVAGELRGSMSNVYSNAIVKSNNIQTGGMVARAKTHASFEDPVNITNCWFNGTVIGGESGRYLGGIVASVIRGTCNLENVLFTGTIDSSYVAVTDETGDTKAVYIGGVIADTKANSLTLNMKSVISAGTITGTHNHSLTHGIIGRVRTAEIDKDGTTSASAQTPTLTLENVFITRDCYETAYGVGEEYTGRKIITEAVTDEEGNIVTEAVTETLTSKVIESGGVVWTTGDDRLIGYIPQNYISEVTGEDGTTEKQTVSASLDFTSAWTMRTNDVPVPTALKDVVDEANLVSNMDAATLAKEVGLDYWNAEAKLTDAESYGAGNYLVTYTTTDSLTYAGYLAKLEGLGFAKYADNSTSDMDDDGVYSSTYCKETSGEWVVNVTYVTNEKKVYISINSDKDSVDDNLKTVTAEGTNAISLSMLEMVNDEGAYGNSFVFQLPNGHFIVNDGGRSADAAELVGYLKELAGETDGVQNPVYIDAWIISHYHGDHSGALAAFYEHPDFREGIFVEAIYASEPNTYALDYWEPQAGVVNNSLHGAMRLTKADGSKPEIYQLHMGQRYYFNGITMDVIDTQEQHPVTTWGDGSVPDQFNTSSTNVLFTFADSTGATKKMLVGGDATNVNMEYMMVAYGSNNKTLANVDVFAAYHHGHNTTATYGETEVNGLTVKGIANKNWADFLLKNTNNSDQKFDVVLFPYYKVYELTWEYGTGFVDDVGSKAYPYNIGTINDYLCDNSTAYYTYGYDDMTGKTVDDPHGTVKITFDGKNTATIYNSWK